MSKCGLVLDSRFEDHDSGPNHPERPERVRAIRRSFENHGFLERCALVPLVAAPDEWITAVHDESYVRAIDGLCARGGGRLDEDTVAGRSSAEVARLAAGSAVALCREVMSGRLERGFAAVRPPGHHAEKDRAMGFCLFNTMAVAARYLVEKEGLERVLIVDWDVHHGNGTQHIFEEDPQVFYFSLHQSPLYPGTGAAHEAGRGSGTGFTLNCPLAPGAGDAEFLAALRGPLVDAAERFKPQFVLVSSGFDAHTADPLAQLQVTTAAYAEATRIVRGIADRYASGRLVSILEGGYDLAALGESAAAHLGVLVEPALAAQSARTEAHAPKKAAVPLAVPAAPDEVPRSVSSEVQAAKRSASSVGVLDEPAPVSKPARTKAPAAKPRKPKSTR